MSTYYKYDPADRGLAINWADVASGISKKLTDEAERREELKSKIDADTRSLEKVLNENVQGQSERASQFSLDFANQASETMLLQQRLLKSGQLSVRDYTVQRQNLLDGTNEVFEVAQQFQDEYERRMERAKGSDEFGTSAQFEQYLMDTIGSFADLNQSAAVVNPEDGNVSLGLKVRDPKTGLVTINQDPNNLRAVSSLRQNLMQDYDMYDIDPVTDKFIARTGNWDTVIRERGTRTMKGLLQKITSQTKKSYTVEELMEMQPGLTREEAQEFLDAGLNPYLEAENDLVSEILSNSFNAASILTDTKGGYKFTRDKKAADGNDKLIYVEDGPNGMLIPSLSEEQKNVADFTIRNNIRNKENRKISTTVVSDYTQRSQTGIDAANEQTEKVDMLTAWFELGYGNKAEQEAAREYILGTEAAKKAGLANMEFIEVKDANDNVTAIDIKFTYVGTEDGEPAQKDITKTFNIDGQDPKQWGRFGSEVVPGLDIRTANRIAEEYSGRDFTNPSIVGGGRKPSRATNRELEASAAQRVRINLQKIEDKFTDDLDADEVSELVSKELAGTGFEVGYIPDQGLITIKHTATGNETEIRHDNGIGTRNAIDTFVTNNIMAEDLRRSGFVSGGDATGGGTNRLAQ